MNDPLSFSYTHVGIFFDSEDILKTGLVIEHCLLTYYKKSITAVIADCLPFFHHG